jgi:hypothetical protein
LKFVKKCLKFELAEIRQIFLVLPWGTRLTSATRNLDFHDSSEEVTHTEALKLSMESLRTWIFTIALLREFTVRGQNHALLTFMVRRLFKLTLAGSAGPAKNLSHTTCIICVAKHLPVIPPCLLSTTIMKLLLTVFPFTLLSFAFGAEYLVGVGKDETTGYDSRYNGLVLKFLQEHS